MHSDCKDNVWFVWMQSKGNKKKLTTFHNASAFLEFFNSHLTL